ncbi:MAG: shikimate dehydrogenase [Actinobacteria bacterium]|uniref:shikimate dehydrogenase (NADP(+)) n=1 Tax=freshwater metagenome TaxID=449393 RepID=A0A6J7CL78_9ZZZZ|nr:shikimate dehydrogenase [Actinomycetota bacterium]MSY12788.1 shikimate dehydrogenase [Actinomycetota bacterium]MSZ03093.1 shikimate dehydrogenase [Actinomycetota bacterium]MTB07394.1 shikimate dehydrogenase [Actinomycetota bacterium]
MSRPPVTGSTRLAGVIGSPVRHSLSPAIHNAGFDECGLDWVYVALEVSSGSAAAALEGMRAFGIAGLSVTMPHKDAVHDFVDERSLAAERMRAVNCVQLVDGRLIGHNTDGDGFVDSLRLDAGVDPSGLSVVVLGAGGAARSVIEALARAGAAGIAVVNRTEARAVEAASLGGKVGRSGTLADIARADLVVNATSVGLGTEEMPIGGDRLRSGQVVADLVYHPLDTALLRAARFAGARALDGLGMLVHQAGRQFELWTGTPAPIAAMRAAAEAELERRRL